MTPVGARGDGVTNALTNTPTNVWTNAAGHAVEATLISLYRDIALFERPDGTRFNMSLASLTPASRQRILEASGRTEVPERLRRDYGLCVRTMKRLYELYAAGELGDDEYSKQTTAALARLEQACVKMDMPKADRDRCLLLARSQ